MPFSSFAASGGASRDPHFPRANRGRFRHRWYKCNETTKQKPVVDDEQNIAFLKGKVDAYEAVLGGDLDLASA